MSRNEIMCFLMNEQNFKYLGNEFSDGNMCNHLVNFSFGKEYVIGVYVYSTAATMALEQFYPNGIRTIQSGTFLLDKNYKNSYRDLFNKLTLELKRRTINTRLEKWRKILILKRKREVERLSDLEFGDELSGYNIPRIRPFRPQLLSNVTVGVQPISQPQRTLFCSKVFVW